MTAENNTFTIKTKRKEHPNAKKYSGRPSMEFGHAFRNFLSDIGPQNVDAFIEGKYIFEEVISAEFFDSILVGDVVGLDLINGINDFGENKNKEPSTYRFKILEIDRDRDIMKVRNVTFETEKGKFKGSELELAFEDFSCALGMGYGEILERDGKPYGVSEEIELKVKIVNLDEKKESSATDPAASTTNPIQISNTDPNNPSGGPTETSGAEETSNSDKV